MQPYYVNLTPHSVDYYHEDGTITSYPKSGIIARMEAVEELVEVMSNKEEIYKMIVTGMNDLPPEQEGIIFIVSIAVQIACVELGMKRNDLVSPYKLIRDDYKNVIGCKSWRRY